MTNSKLKAMMEAQKKSRMKPGLYLKPLSTTGKMVYVPPIRATITKHQEAQCAQTLASPND